MLPRLTPGKNKKGLNSPSTTPYNYTTNLKVPDNKKPRNHEVISVKNL